MAGGSTTTDDPRERVPGGRVHDAVGIKQQQEAYHDWEAETYDDKFSISYDQRCIDYAVGRFRKAVPEGTAYAVPDSGPTRALELGAGTGFFAINLFLGGCLPDTEVHVNDISEGMLGVCKRNAAEHGLEVHARQGDAEDLPYADDTFDLVVGHAFVHHLPDVGAALGEMRRVLKPGGTLVIAGEPTRLGHRNAEVVKRATYRTVRAALRVPGVARLRRPSVAELHGDEEAFLASLEHVVDLHEFDPHDLATLAGWTGLHDVRLVTEELTSNWLGWVGRTCQGMLREELFVPAYAYAMFGAYRALNWLDEHVLTHVVPDRFFYNLVLSATKPRA